MQRLAFLVLSVAAVAAARIGGGQHEMNSALPQYHSEEFLGYVARYGKKYCSSTSDSSSLLLSSSAAAEEKKRSGSNSENRSIICEESILREKIYWENKKFIEEYNAKYTSHQLEINAFADLTSDEFKQQQLCNINPAVSDEIDAEEFQDDSVGSVPTSVDWREHGLVTPVKNQGQCGACWAFAAVASIEGAYAKTTSRLVSLSEQELVDCDKTSNGCDGGYFEQAFQWVIENHGINSELHYPYVENDDQPCSRPKQQHQEGMITSSVRLQTKNETQMMLAVSQQPISVSIQADHKGFQFYRKGIFDGNCGGTDLNHAVAIIGYGEEDDSPYWIVKNSWATNWGEDGFMRIKRGSNQCGLATNPSYPIFK